MADLSAKSERPSELREVMSGKERFKIRKMVNMNVGGGDSAIVVGDGNEEERVRRDRRRREEEMEDKEGDEREAYLDLNLGGDIDVVGNGEWGMGNRD